MGADSSEILVLLPRIVSLLANIRTTIDSYDADPFGRYHLTEQDSLIREYNWWMEWYVRTTAKSFELSWPDSVQDVRHQAAMKRLSLDELISELRKGDVIVGSIVEDAVLARNFDEEYNRMRFHRLMRSTVSAASREIREAHLGAVVQSLEDSAERELDVLRKVGTLTNTKLLNSRIRVGLERCAFKNVDFVDCQVGILMWYGCVVSTVFRGGRFSYEISGVEDGDVIGMSDFKSTVFYDVLFDAVQFTHVDFEHVIFIDCDFRNVQRPNGRGSRIYFDNCTFLRCTFEHFDFRLDRTDPLMVDLNQCVVVACRFVDCDFGSLDLRGTKFLGCDFSAARFESVSMERAGHMRSLGSYRVDSHHSEPFDEYLLRAYVRTARGKKRKRSKIERRDIILTMRKAVKPFRCSEWLPIVDLANVFAYYPPAIPTLLLGALTHDRERLLSSGGDSWDEQAEATARRVRIAESFLASESKTASLTDVEALVSWWKEWYAQRGRQLGRPVDNVYEQMIAQAASRNRVNLEDCIEAIQGGEVLARVYVADEFYSSELVKALEQDATLDFPTLDFPRLFEENLKELLPPIHNRKLAGRALIINSVFDRCELQHVQFLPGVMISTTFSSCRFAFLGLDCWKVIDCAFYDSIFLGSRSAVMPLPISDGSAVLEGMRPNIIVFLDVTFEACIIGGIDWSSSTFVRCHFRGVTFESLGEPLTRFERASFIDCTFEDVLFDGSVSFNYSLFDGCGFVECRLAGAHLSGCRFLGCDLTGLLSDEAELGDTENLRSYGSYRVGTDDVRLTDELVWAFGNGRSHIEGR